MDKRKYAARHNISEAQQIEQGLDGIQIVALGKSTRVRRGASNRPRSLSTQHELQSLEPQNRVALRPTQKQERGWRHSRIAVAKHGLRVCGTQRNQSSVNMWDNDRIFCWSRATDRRTAARPFIAIAAGQQSFWDQRSEMWKEGGSCRTLRGRQYRLREQDEAHTVILESRTESRQGAFIWSR